MLNFMRKEQDRMYNKKFHEQFELFDSMNNAPPVIFNFTHEGGKEPRTERIGVRISKIYLDMLAQIANDNRATISDVVNEIFFHLWLDYQTAAKDLRREKEERLRAFADLPEQEQERYLNDRNLIVAKSGLAHDILKKYNEFQKLEEKLKEPEKGNE
jgi:hypothetical protein